jgi:hypothetical protein
MRNFTLSASVLLLAPLALAACQPSRDATKANEAIARGGGRATAVTTLPPDESAATPSESLTARRRASAKVR